MVEGGFRDGLCETRPGAALCSAQQVPASSMVDPPQDAGESISQPGGTLVKMYLRKGKKYGKKEDRGTRGKQKARAEGDAPQQRNCGPQVSLCWSRCTREGTAAHGETRWRGGKTKNDGAAEEKSGKQRVAETTCCAVPITSPKGLSVTCRDNKGSGDQEGGRKRV